MFQPQTGLCAEPNSHAYYLMFDIQAGAESEIRLALAHFPELCEELASSYPEASFSGLVGVGSEAWERLYSSDRRYWLLSRRWNKASEWRLGHRLTCFQLRAERVDILHLAGQRLMARLAGKVLLREERHGFRFFWIAGI